MARKVPLIISEPAPDFGEVKDDPAFRAPDAAAGDLSYVPGWSEMRRRRDQETLECAQGIRRPQDVVTLSVNLHWGRTQSKSGTPDSRKILNHARKGYRAVTRKDLGAEWFRELPPGASFAADGSVMQGDTVLLVTDATNAARSLAEKARRTRELVHGAEESLSNLKGGSITKEPGPPFIQGKGQK